VIFKATEEFWRKFYDLPAAQKQSVREKWKIFHEDPFHPSLGTHKIERLSGLAKHTIRSVVIEDDFASDFSNRWRGCDDFGHRNARRLSIKRGLRLG
jgi:hypothetical protein